MCGFLGFSAQLSCSKCFKKFPRESFGSRSRPDYSGYEPDKWPLRTLQQYKNAIGIISSTELNQAVKETGFHYSELSRLIRIF